MGGCVPGRFEVLAVVVVVAVVVEVVVEVAMVVVTPEATIHQPIAP